MEDWIKDLREFVCDSPDPSEFISYSPFVGEKHSQFGIPKTDRQKKHQSEKIKKWWQDMSTTDREEMGKRISSGVKSQWDSLTKEERKTSRNWKPNPRPGKYNPMYGKPSAVRGKIWVTDGENNKMVNVDEIPEGWYKGRVNVISAEGKEKLSNLTTQRNKERKLK